MARLTGTIKINQSEVHFGDIVTVSYTANFDRPWARLTVYRDNQMLQDGYISLDGINDYFVLGPTPSWSGGAGVATLYLLKFNTRKGVFFPPIAQDTFEVLA